MTTLRAGCATHVGQVRSNNQDSALMFKEANLYGVADGMGGHQGGEVASAMAVDLATKHAGDRTLESLKQAARVANRAIFEKAGNDPELHGMGTTLVAVQLVDGPEGDEIGWINVGDSRVYLLRDGQLIQLSHDHSLVEDLVRDGRISRDEAKVHPQRNILTRALGIDLDVNVDSGSLLPLAGDRYLLCSDGLFNEVSVDQMSAVLRRLVDPDEAAAELVRLANESGGRDNITVVVVDVIDDDGRAAAIAEAQEAARQAAEAKAAAERAAAEEAARQAALTEQEHDQPTEAPVFADRRSSLPEAQDDYAAEKDDLFSDLERVRTRRLTWRVVAFCVLLLLVGAAVVAALYFSQSGTYHARINGDRVSVYKGEDGGFLGRKAEFQYDMRLDVDDIPEPYRSELQEGIEFPSLQKARQWEFNVADAIESRTTTTTTTTSTTTTTEATTTSTTQPTTTSTTPSSTAPAP